MVPTVAQSSWGLGSHLEDFRVPIGRGQVQGCAAPVVSGIRIGPQDKQVPNNLRGCSCCCHQQGSLGDKMGGQGGLSDSWGELDV